MTQGESNERVSVVVGLGEVGWPLLDVLGRSHRVEGIDLPARDVADRVDFMHVCYPAEIVDFVGTTEGYRVAVPVVHSPVRGKHVRMVEELTGRRSPHASGPAEAFRRSQRGLRASYVWNPGISPVGR